MSKLTQEQTEEIEKEAEEYAGNLMANARYTVAAIKDYTFAATKIENYEGIRKKFRLSAEPDVHYSVDEITS